MDTFLNGLETCSIAIRWDDIKTLSIRLDSVLCPGL